MQRRWSLERSTNTALCGLGCCGGQEPGKASHLGVIFFYFLILGRINLGMTWLPLVRKASRACVYVCTTFPSSENGEVYRTTPVSWSVIGGDTARRADTPRELRPASCACSTVGSISGSNGRVVLKQTARPTMLRSSCWRRVRTCARGQRGVRHHDLFIHVDWSKSFARMPRDFCFLKIVLSENTGCVPACGPCI